MYKYIISLFFVQIGQHCLTWDISRLWMVYRWVGCIQLAMEQSITVLVYPILWFRRWIYHFRMLW